MKKEISPIAVIVALVALVAVLGYFGYRAMTPEPVQGMDRAEFKRRMQQYQDSTSMKGSGGGAPRPGGMGGYPGGQDGKPVPPTTAPAANPPAANPPANPPAGQ